MQLDFARKRDLIAGVVIALCGVGAILGALDYGLGTLRRMGPGLFPNVLGVLMIAVGLIIAQRAVFAAHEAGEEEAEAFTPPDLRGGLFILAGAVAFLGLANYGGFIPATFSCVFISALGDRDNTLPRSAALALGVTFFGALLFHYGLHIQMPLFRWGG